MLFATAVVHLIHSRAASLWRTTRYTLSETVPPPYDGLRGVVADWSADKQAFPVPWGKAMMWIFLLSDTFIFTCFLTVYMNVRM